MLQQKVRRWLESSAGEKAIARALKQAQKYAADLRKCSVVPDGVGIIRK
jgi:hypothetical protein